MRGENEWRERKGDEDLQDEGMQTERVMVENGRFGNDGCGEYILK